MLSLRYNVDMTTAMLPVPAERVPVLREPSRSLAESQRPPQSLQDLLVAIASTTITKPKLGMLRVVANEIASFKGTPLDSVPIEVLSTLGLEFKIHLQMHHPNRNTVRTYFHRAHVLLTTAKEFGLVQLQPALLAEWEPVRRAMTMVGGTLNIIRYAISIERAPRDFSLADLRCWRELMQHQSRSYDYVDKEQSRFRGAMAKCGLTQNLSDVYQYRGRYGTPLSQLPDALRAEIVAVMTWKQARFARGRRRGSCHRAVSAKKLTEFICRMYGFAAGVQKLPGITSLTDLVTEEIVTGFVAWYLNERQRKTHPLRSNLGLLAAAMKQYPAFKGHDFSWLDDLVKNLEEDETEEEERQQRKSRQAVPYDVLAEVPGKIRLLREAGGHTAMETAIMVRNELLLRWWLALPWRQRNIRECRIGTNANLFKAEVPSSVPIRKPDWVIEGLERDPRARFWQIRFSKAETKSGNKVHAIVPLQLVALLEEYLRQHRGILPGEQHDPGTLFLDDSGRAFTDKSLVKVLENLTFQYVGKPINPHLLRDIFAYKWLDDHPEDYATLAVILWHRDIRTTLRIYGRDFNESNGICSIDAWLRRRTPSVPVLASMRTGGRAGDLG